MLVVSSFAIAAYVVAVTALTWGGAVVDAGAWWLWALRTVMFAALAVASLMTAREFGRGRRSELEPRERAGIALVAVGVTWFELSAIDMHVLGLYELTNHSTPLDAVFHGAGLLVALVGWRLLPVRTVVPPLARRTPELLRG